MIETGFLLLSTQNIPTTPFDPNMVKLDLVTDNETYMPDALAVTQPLQPTIQSAEGFKIETMASDLTWLGLESPTNLKALWLLNMSDFDLTLAHDDVSTLEADRFALPDKANYVVQPNMSIRLSYLYDRWMIVG